MSTEQDTTPGLGGATPDPAWPARDPQPRSRGLSAIVRSGTFKTVVSLAAGLGLWELVGRFWLTNQLFFVPFSTAVAQLWDGLTTGPLLNDLKTSLVEIIIGYLVAVAVGVVVGVLLGLNRRVRDYLITWVDIFNATPILALAPIFVLRFGVGLESKIVFVAFVSVWTIIVNTMTGFRYADESMVEMVSSFGASDSQTFRYVRVPLAVPSVATGLRLAIGHAIVGMVVGELFGSSAGLGYELFAYKSSFDTGGIFAVIILLALIAIIAVRLMGMLERYVSRWRVSEDGAGS